MAPVTTRGASFCIFSSSFTSYWVQLSQITSAYSRSGWIKVKWLSIKFKFKFTHNINAAPCFWFNIIEMIMPLSVTWKKHAQMLICVWTSLIGWLFIKMGGWLGLLSFLEKIIDSDFVGLNVTSHWVAHWWIIYKSVFNCLAVLCGLSIIM